jgi:hypothetical protein
MRSLPGVANGGMEAAHMRKFLIGSLLRELATILGAIIAGGTYYLILQHNGVKRI